MAALAVVDELEGMMRGLEPQERCVLELRLQGHTLSEISAETGRSMASVRRTLAWVKQWLEQAEAHNRS